MKTTLQDIADRLAGYDEKNYFEITEAERLEDGAWSLVIKHHKEEETNVLHDRVSK